jgi:hypothetical protein
MLPERGRTMITAPAPNLMSRPYRGLSVQEVGFALTERALMTWITGRKVYRRTEFILVRNGIQGALIMVARRDSDDLFGPVREARLLAGPGELVMLDSPETDVGNATALAEVAGRHRQPDALAYAVTGRYQHVNFIWQPQPVTVLVDDVVPPHPAKLADMARQALAFDEDLPPVRLIERLISIPQLMRSARPGHCLLPCQGAHEASDAADLEFLDRGPAYRPDWTLIGCRRSEQIFERLYGHRPESVSFCPELSGTTVPVGTCRLTKCCLTERGIRTAGPVAVVPWGARLDEVRTALAHVVTSREDGVG